MPDIFISYSRKDGEVAAAVARLLAREGYEVFWDVRLQSGRRWRSQLEREIRSAKCTLVLWSSNSVKSSFVRWEAETAISADNYTPAALSSSSESFSPSEIPEEFSHHHMLKIAAPEGPGNLPVFDAIVRALDEREALPSQEERFSRLASDAWRRKWARNFSRFGDVVFPVDGRLIALTVSLIWAIPFLGFVLQHSIFEMQEREALRREHYAGAQRLTSVEAPEYLRSALIQSLSSAAREAGGFESAAQNGSSASLVSAVEHGEVFPVWRRHDGFGPTGSRQQVGLVGVFVGLEAYAGQYFGRYVGLDGFVWEGEFACGSPNGRGRWLNVNAPTQPSVNDSSNATQWAQSAGFAVRRELWGVRASERPVFMTEGNGDPTVPISCPDGSNRSVIGFHYVIDDRGSVLRLPCNENVPDYRSGISVQFLQRLHESARGGEYSRSCLSFSPIEPRGEPLGGVPQNVP